MRLSNFYFHNNIINNVITTFVREDGGGFLFVFDDENWWQIDRSTSHSTARGNMIQVCCQSWFIIAQADCDKYGIKQMFKRMEIIVEKHSEKHSSKADCEIYG